MGFLFLFIFFFRTLLRFGGSALAVAGCLARERDGLHIPRRLESMWGTPERGRGGQKHPGSGLVHSEPGERPPTPAEVGLHIVHFQTGLYWYHFSSLRWTKTHNSGNNLQELQGNKHLKCSWLTRELPPL